MKLGSSRVPPPLHSPKVLALVPCTAELLAIAAYSVRPEGFHKMCKTRMQGCKSQVNNLTAAPLLWLQLKLSENP